MQEEGRGAYRFSEATWRPVTAPEARNAARAMHQRAFQQGHAARPNVLPQVAGKHIARCDPDSVGDQHQQISLKQMNAVAPDTTKRPRTVPCDSCSGSDGTGQHVQMINVEPGQDQAIGDERRPLTAAGSSVYATAIRQLESEQLQLVCCMAHSSTWMGSGFLTPVVVFHSQQII